MESSLTMNDRVKKNATWITDSIVSFTETSKENSLALDPNEKIFNKPLVGFSNGADPIYDEFKRHIGNFYFTPTELFNKNNPDLTVTANELTVISWIIPSTDKTRKEQGARNRHPSERWARTRFLGENFNNSIRRHVVALLNSEGIAALAPLLSSHWSRSDQGPYAPCSNWSERHAAYAAGLGTFGLCDGLITPVGKAVRIGSVIAQINIPPTTRPDDHHAYCLHYTHNTCRKCIPRCPVKALSPDGHDKKKCMQYTEHSMNIYIKNKYGIETYACGLCQAGVPCTNKIPTLEDLE